MYKLGDFLDCAMTNFSIVIVEGEKSYITTVNEVDEKYNDRVFTCWDMYNGKIVLYLD